MAICFIRCLKCSETFPSPIQFGSAAAFYTSTLKGNVMTCPECREATGVNKENMIYRDAGGGGGFVGTDVRKDT